MRSKAAETSSETKLLNSLAELNPQLPRLTSLQLSNAEGANTFTACAVRLQPLLLSVQRVFLHS